MIRNLFFRIFQVFLIIIFYLADKANAESLDDIEGEIKTRTKLAKLKTKRNRI